MGNHAIEATERKAHRYGHEMLAWVALGCAKLGFWKGKGERMLQEAEEREETVHAFNAELSDCKSCIAPDVPAGLTDPEAIAASIEHFRDLARQCENYADALEAIARANFQEPPQ